MSKLLPLLLLFGFLSFLPAQDAYRQSLFRGNQAYDAKDYKQSTKEFLEATRKNPKAFGGQYNLSNALYQDKQLDQAIEGYQRASKLATTPAEKAAALYNQANAQLENKDVKGAVESYRQALHHDPGNAAIIQNLQIAKKIEQQQQKQQQQQNKQGNQGQKQPNPGESQNPQQGQKSPTPGTGQQNPQNQPNPTQGKPAAPNPQQPNGASSQAQGSGGHQPGGQQNQGQGQSSTTPQNSGLPKGLEQQLLQQMGDKERQTARRILNRSTNATYQSKEKDW